MGIFYTVNESVANVSDLDYVKEESYSDLSYNEASVKVMAECAYNQVIFEGTIGGYIGNIESVNEGKLFSTIKEKISKMWKAFKAFVMKIWAKIKGLFSKAEEKVKEDEKEAEKDEPSDDTASNADTSADDMNYPEIVRTKTSAPTGNKTTASIITPQKKPDTFRAPAKTTSAPTKAAEPEETVKFIAVAKFAEKYIPDYINNVSHIKKMMNNMNTSVEKYIATTTATDISNNAEYFTWSDDRKGDFVANSYKYLRFDDSDVDSHDAAIAKVGIQLQEDIEKGTITATYNELSKMREKDYFIMQKGFFYMKKKEKEVEKLFDDILKSTDATSKQFEAEAKRLFDNNDTDADKANGLANYFTKVYSILSTKISEYQQAIVKMTALTVRLSNMNSTQRRMFRRYKNRTK